MMRMIVTNLKYVFVFVVVLQFLQSVRTKIVCSRSQKYHTSCGPFGWSRCTRYRLFYRRADIANCIDERCNPDGTSLCDKCDGENGDSIGNAYKRSSDNKRCIKQCSWRNDSNACYPGTCRIGNPGISTCQCESYVSGLHCTTINDAPIILEYQAKISQGLTTRESPPSAGESPRSNTMYVNIKNFNDFEVSLTTSYQPGPLPLRPAYLHVTSPAKLGVTQVSVTVTIQAIDTLHQSRDVGIQQSAWKGAFDFDQLNPSTFNSNTR
ncbi:uncharacterized protein [Amphiura filiformis]|uniref:uncharacterized protein n=1 Tax=Amphiura filiformis TaxID=82378 RepID=UPI003B21E7A4